MILQRWILARVGGLANAELEKREIAVRDALSGGRFLLDVRRGSKENPLTGYCFTDIVTIRKTVS